MSSVPHTKFAEINEKIVAACQRCHRSPGSVKLIAVTKALPMHAIETAMRHGITDIGESRIQEALPKIAAMNEQYPEQFTWHLIGHLQENKVTKAVGTFHCIHSVNSEKLLEKISTTALDRQHVQDILIQVNVTSEETKQGFSPEALRDIFPTLRLHKGVRIRGLMTIAPFTTDQEVLDLCFWKTAQLRSFLEHRFSVVLPELSMGMSGDFQLAIEHGATMIRIGRALFGERV